MFVQVLPASADFQTPSPEFELRAQKGSPVPTQTTFESDGATATSPIESLGCPSNIGSKVVPLLTVLHTPPFRVPT